MNIVKRFQSQAHGPALVEVSFPDGIPYPAQGGRSTMLSPRHAWTDLAKEKAAELGADIGFRNIDGGLQVAFRSHDDCARVLAAMEPEWRDRLRQGLGYWVRMQFRSAERAEERGQAYDPKPTVTQMAESFGLEYDDLADLGAPAAQR